MSTGRPSAPAEPARLLLNRSVVDDLVLTTIDGAEDFLTEDLAHIPVVASIRRGSGEATCHLHGPLAALHRVRLYATAALPLSAVPGDAAFVDPLRRSANIGVLSAISSDTPLGFRIGTAATDLRRDLVSRIESEMGWVNDPSSWEVNLEKGPHGWVAQVGSLHWTRRFGALERLPWSTTPLVAEVMIRLLKTQPGLTVLDPLCGTGTLLLAVDHRSPGCTLLGTDRDADAITKAKINLDRFGVRADLSASEAVPIGRPAGSVDRVLSNLPFGKLVGTHQDNEQLYPRLLNEISRVLTPTGRAVLLTEDKRLLVDSVARTKGLKIVRERLLRHGGATPTAYVLTRTRR